MDLGTMGRKLRAGAYLCVEQFAQDVALIAANAARFNGAASPYTQMAAALRDQAMRWLSALPAGELDARGALAQQQKEADEDGCAPAEADVNADSHSLENAAQAECAAPTAASSPSNTQQALTPAQQPPSDCLPEPCGDAPAAAAAAAQEELVLNDALGAEAPAPLCDTDDLLAELGPDVWRACMQPSSAAARLPPLPRAVVAACRGSSARRRGTPAAALSSDACAEATLRASLEPLLRQAGFAAAEASALDTLHDVAASHLLRLGQALRRLADTRAAALQQDLAVMPGAGVPVTADMALLCIQQAGPPGLTWQSLSAHVAQCSGAADGDAVLPAAKRAHKVEDAGHAAIPAAATAEPAVSVAAGNGGLAPADAAQP
jgi:hypothetical protein